MRIKSFLRKIVLVFPLIFLFFFTCSNSPRPTVVNPVLQTVTVASFNIRIFSNTSRNDQELGYIADILDDYDIIAIQELRDEKVLQRTISILNNRGREYGYDISAPVGKEVKERYAFLYRKDKVKEIYPGKLYKKTKDEFIREPFYATFKANNFDFTLITVHILFGANEKERRPEIKELAKVYNKVQAEDPKEQDILLCGDFNFPPTDVGFNDLKAIPTMAFLIAPPAKTIISDTNLYDNFWFQKKFVQEYTGISGVNKYDESMFGNDDKKAKEAVSDHRPIWAKFEITKKDDD